VKNIGLVNAFYVNHRALRSGTSLREIAPSRTKPILAFAASSTLATPASRKITYNPFHHRQYKRMSRRHHNRVQNRHPCLAQHIALKFLILSRAAC
jgi:hypothetical protein